jgi:3-dehydroquinate synthase
MNPQPIILTGKYGTSTVWVGERIGNLAEHLPAGNVFAITDENLYRHYPECFKDMPVYVIKPGEQSKTVASIEEACRWLMTQGAGRDAFILGVGGGVVCDITGFVASVFMRGVDFGFVATSFLAQVDGSIGGKNGVNLDGYKNIIGTFNQPCFVICDTNMLHTLSAVEFKNGMAEVIKHALIADKEMFDFIKNHHKEILRLTTEAVNYMVKRSVEIKSAIVSADEREQGERRKLNLGHTWGHAVEKTDGIPHGQAVSIGLVFAADLSVKKGLLKTDERDELLRLLKQFDLPTETQTSPEKIYDILLKDKKKEKNHIHFVLMNGIGKVSVEPIGLAELKSFAKGLQS